VVDKPGDKVNLSTSKHKYFRDDHNITTPLCVAGEMADGRMLELFYLEDVVLPVVTTQDGVRHMGDVIDRSEPGQKMELGELIIGQPSEGGTVKRIDSVTALYKNFGRDEDSSVDNPFTEPMDRIQAYFEEDFEQ
jgi:hypothetical protein